VVNVSVVDVLHVDTVIRRGAAAAEFWGVSTPFVPGVGVAGHVSAVGSDVSSEWIGRRVVTDTASFGGYAEHAAAPAENLVAVPDQIDLTDAAALLHDGRTALGVFDNAEVKPGDSVLVTAAAGGAGLLLLQMARAAGARVIGAARGDRKLDAAREAGAGVAVDYSRPDWTTNVLAATGGDGVDVVFDGAGGAIGLAAVDITAPGGRVSTHGAPSGAFTEIDHRVVQHRGITVRGVEQVQFAPADARAMVERALALAAGGRFTPVIGQNLPLERAADAHAAIEARSVVGKTLLTT
jgi:NADPH2:quinone reductase